MQGLKLIVSRFDRNYLVLAAMALVVHGLVLFNDGVYWDGWMIYTNLITKNWNNMYSWFIEAGLPTQLFIHWLLGYLPDVVLAHKVTAFASLFFAGILTYAICRESGMLNRLEGLFIALFSLTYPAVQVAIELDIAPYVFLYALFLLAVFLAMKSIKSNGNRQRFFRCCSLVLFFISFGLNSLLVFYFGFLIFVVIYLAYLDRIPHQMGHVRLLLSHLDFAFLPFLYWFVKESFFPRYGLYDDYNRFQFSLSLFASHSAGFFNNAIYGQFNTGIIELVLQPPVLLFACFILIQLLYLTLGTQSGFRFSEHLSSYFILAFGLVLLILGIFPYVIVGVSPYHLHGWSTRHAILVPLPLAIITLALTRLFLSGKGDSLSRISFTFLAILVLAFSISTNRTYSSWQARWVKDRSIMEHLKDSDANKDVSIYWIDDQFPRVGGEYYRFYEWSSMFKTVWGGQSRIGIDSGTNLTEFLAKTRREVTGGYNGGYNLAEFNPQGCQAILTIRRGSEIYSDQELSIRYLFKKFFRSTDSVHKFLSEITDVQIMRISAPEAIDCST